MCAHTCIPRGLRMGLCFQEPLPTRSFTQHLVVSVHSVPAVFSCWDRATTMFCAMFQCREVEQLVQREGGGPTIKGQSRTWE